MYAIRDCCTCTPYPNVYSYNQITDGQTCALIQVTELIEQYIHGITPPSNFISSRSLSAVTYCVPPHHDMATLNLSTNGPSISESYQSVVDAPVSSGNAAHSPTYGQWAVFSVSAPLANAFQRDTGGTGGKESVLKVQSTGGN